MKPFLTEDFLLQTETARRLYHEYAKTLPVFDYHCHLPVSEIAGDRNFSNLTEIWLKGDHYKWRAMRANGISEEYITGGATDREKFQAWAATVPKTLRNPLYHWTHLELKNPFGIEDILLSSKTADYVYDFCTELLQSREFSSCGLLKMMQVAVVCTTDDPVDSLEHHQHIDQGDFCPTRVLPAFRPDRVIAIDDPTAFNDYLTQLEAAANVSIGSYSELRDALAKRLQYFHDNGCRLSDHSLWEPCSEPGTDRELDNCLNRLRSGHHPTPQEAIHFKSSVLLDLARMYAEKNWVQQYHFGALRDTNSGALEKLGPDTGFDSIGDGELARPLARFFNILASEGALAKTIVYNLNPRDNELLATMIGNYQDGTVAGKMQFGAAWWFNDQKDGMERQLNALSNMGLLSRFVGMLTDSRSFLSYPRHEYFRRILCNLFGQDVERGELPHDLELIGKTVADICYHNAVDYFKLPPQSLR